MAKRPITPRQRHSGVALLIMLAILAIGMTSLVLAALNSSTGNETIQVRNRNAAALAQAKEALIGYIVKQAASYTENAPGELPCPEAASDAGTVNEGASSGYCNSTDATNKTIGRLPWLTLGIDKLVDASSEPLWYAVSEKWVPTANGAPPTPPIINISTANATPAGNFTVDGVSGVVAVIIAPGRPLVTNPTAAQIAQGCVARSQTRNDRSHVSGGGNPDYRDYLECENASAPIDVNFGSAIINNATNAVINDQMVTITASEILSAIQAPLSDRMQRTVAPLLSEFADKWVGGGTKFLPYPVSWATAQPDAGVASGTYCGTAGNPEGLLPIAVNTAPCTRSWASTNITTTDSLAIVGCSAASATAPVVCQFRYYRFTALGQFILGITGVGSVSANYSANTPGVTTTFRWPITASDVTVTSGAATISNFTLSTPKSDGSVDLSFKATVTQPNICKDGLVAGLVCNTLSGLLATTTTVTVQYPQLPTPTLVGSKLATAVTSASRAGPYSLLAPVAGATTADPHYWFIRNEWYRHTYYAVAGSATIPSSGGYLTINGFPGTTNDKNFVLTLMGPAVSGQTRTTTAALSNYVEGTNAVTTASPRAFAYQVYTSAGNDRLAACPYTGLCD